jgi:hypothetical protein
VKCFTVNTIHKDVHRQCVVAFHMVEVLSTCFMECAELARFITALHIKACKLQSWHALHAHVCANNTLYLTHAPTSNVSSICTILHKNATNSKEQRPSSEADSSPAGEEILCHLKNSILCWVHKSPPLDMTNWAIWTQSTHTYPPPPSSVRSILTLLSHLWLSLPSGHPFSFLSKIFYALLISPIHATCLIHLRILGFESP